MAVVKNENEFEAGKITLWLDEELVNTVTTLQNVELPNETYDTVKVGKGASVSGLTIEDGGTILVDKEGVIGALVLGGSAASNYTGGVYQGGGIARNNTGWYGAAICATSANITLTEALFEDNAAEALNGYNGLGGAIEVYGGVLSITDSVFNANTAGGETAAGGAICAMSGATVTVNGGLFHKNEAAYGGALQQWGGTLSITGTEFTENIARIGGGALEMHGGVTAMVKDSTFTKNTAAHGGAVYNDTYGGASADLSIENASFEQNTADLGGAVYNYAELQITGSTFTGNTVNLPEGWNTDKGFGGAIANTISGDLAVAESTFTGNTAKNGGAIANWINYGESGSATAEITDSIFEQNSAENGGAVYQSGAATDLVTITDSDFTGNTASYAGGAVVNVFGQLVVSGGTFTENTAVNDGGAIALWNGGEVENALFTENSAAYGGAISNSWSGPAVTISGCSFAGNTATVSGGAIWNDNNGCEVMTVSGCTFTGNTATVSGGAIFNEYKMTLKNSTFTTVTDTVCNSGELTLSGTNSFSAAVENTGTVLFDLSDRTVADQAMVNDLAYLSGAGLYAISVKADQAEGAYRLAGAFAESFADVVFAVQDDTGKVLDRISVADVAAGKRYALSVDNSGALVLTIGETAVAQHILVVPENTAVVEFCLQKDDSSAVRIVPVYANSLTTYNLPDETLYRTAKDAGDKVIGESVVLTDAGGENRIVAAASDNRADIFFVRKPEQVWSASYSAQHLGCKDGWSGTSEKVNLLGMNKIEDIFNGAETDAAILYLTDTANGDALFVDDIYGGSFQDLAQENSRLANLNEIRAGEGDDLVDLTSQRFEYIGDSLTVRGGNGNDTIWANHGENHLFGDGGNDRIIGAAGNDWIAGGSGDDSLHGGGGDDLFLFCENWGTDIVEQLSGGNVTLWFKNGSAENWDEVNMLYSDGGNTVKVSGVSQVNLKFGNDGSTEFAALDQCGAFLEESSQKIFEEKGADPIPMIV